jgi:hypothetical protein
MPVPMMLKTCAVLLAESINVSVPVREPIAVGVKVKSTSQPVWGPLELNVAPAQFVLLAIWKSPVIDIWPIMTGCVPMLLINIDFTPLAVPTIWLGNTKFELNISSV